MRGEKIIFHKYKKRGQSSDSCDRRQQVRDEGAINAAGCTRACPRSVARRPLGTPSPAETLSILECPVMAK